MGLKVVDDTSDKSTRLMDAVIWLEFNIGELREALKEREKLRETIRRQHREVLQLRAQVRELGGVPQSINPAPRRPESIEACKPKKE
jgi:hypothetical protein